MKTKTIVFNNIEYNIISEIEFNNIFYYLIGDGEKIKIVYRLEDEYYQMINNDNYKEIIDQLYLNIN